MAKAWEIDFKDVEKALGIGDQQKQVDQPPSPALTGDSDRYAPTPTPSPALTGDSNRYDQVAQQLGLGDTTPLDQPVAQQPVPDTSYHAPNQWDQVVNDLSTPQVDNSKPAPAPLVDTGIQLSTPPVDTSTSQFTVSTPPVDTVATPITADSSNGQRRVDSAGQAPAGGVFDAIGNTLIAAPAAITQTPGYRAMTQRNEANIAAATADGSGLSPMESLQAGGAAALNLLGLGADAVKTTQIPGLGVSVGQLAKTAVDASGNPDMGWGLNFSLPEVKYNPSAISDFFGQISQGVQTWQGINKQVDSVSPELKPDASMALLNVYSGYDTVQKTLSDIVNKDGNVQSLIDRAQQAQNAGDALGAATLGAQAQNLANTSAVELVDKRTSILPELGYTLFLDPLNAVGEVFKLAELTPEATRATSAARLFDVTPAEALAKLPSAVEDAAIAAGIVEKGGSLLSVWDKINPFARTPEALAAKDSNTLYRTITSIIGDVTNKADAQAIITTLVDKPEELVKGLYGLVSDGLVNRADSTGRVAFDAGTVANDEVLGALPVIRLAAERLRNMAATAGEGLLNKTEFISEFDNIINDAARRAYGLDKLIDLPVGTRTASIVTEGKNAFIRFVDAQGREAGRTAAMTIDAAKSKLSDLNKAITATGGNFNIIKSASSAQRAIMSEIWLNMHPSHWVGNAVSAYTHLFADGLYTFKSTDEIVNELQRIAGGVTPSSRVAGALAGAEDARSMFRNIPIIGRPLAAFSEFGARVKGGNNALFGRLAVGEQNFYMRAFHSGFTRAFEKNWTSTVSRELDVVLKQLGVDPTIAENLINVATEAGLRSGKQEMVNEFRRAVNAVQTSFTLKQFGIEATDISPQGQRALSEMFGAGVPSVQEAISRVNGIFRDESRRWQEILRTASPEPGRYAWTTLEHLGDAADITDDLGRAAKQAGINPGDAPQQLANAVTQTEQKIYDSLFYELGGTTDPVHLNIAMDMWGQLHDAKQGVRQRLGALADEATKANTDQSWATYFQAARQEWDNYSKLAQRIGDQARIDLQAAQSGQAVTRRFDAWSMLEDYANIDEQQLLQLRQQGFDLGKVADAQGRFKQILDAQRRFVDAYTTQAYGAFNRYQSLDSLDLMISAQRDAETLGAKAAAYVGEARDKLFANEISAEEFYRIRNQTWYELADAQASRWLTATKEMIFNAEKEKFPTRLRFTNDFAGGEFELIKPVKQGEQTFWYARNVEDGTTHRFGDPGDKNVGLPRVPQSVINDYNNMLGDLEKLVQTVEPPPEAIRVIEAAKPPLTTQYNVSADARPLASTEARATVQDIAATKQDLMRMWDKASAQIEGMPSINEMAMRLGTRNGGGTPDININGVRWDDSPVVREFAEKMFGKDATGEDVLSWLRDYSKLTSEADVAKSTLADIRKYRGMKADDILKSAESEGILDAATVADMTGKSTREEVLNVIESAQGKDPNMQYYEHTTPMIDTATLEAKWAEQANVDMNSYKIDPKAQLQKWFNLSGDGTPDLYKAVTEANNGRASLGGTWQPGMGDYANYMAGRTEAARRKIIQNIESIIKGTPNTMAPNQRLRAFDAMVNLAREYDGAVGAASKAASDMADFAMLNFADRRNIDNIIGLWTPYHYWFTRSAKNWIERSAMKPSLLADYFKFTRAADLHAQQNDLPNRLAGKIPLFKNGDTTYYIPNPIEIMLPYNMYAVKGFDDPETANNAFERTYMYAQMLGFGALPVYDAIIKVAQGKGSEIAAGDYIPQYRAINYLYQSITGQSLPGGGDRFDAYRTGRQASLEAIRGNTSPTLAQWAQDIAYQVMDKVGALPEQPKEAQAVYESAARAAGWDRSLAVLGSFFLGLPMYTYTDAEKAAREAGQKYRDVGYSSTGNEFGSKAAKNAVMDQAPWLSAWWSKSSLAPQDSQSGSQDKFVRPGAQASFNEMQQAKEQLSAQQNAQIDQYIQNEYAKGTDPLAIQKGVWAIINQYKPQRDAITAAHPSAAIPSSSTPYNGYNPQELAQKATELAVSKAKDAAGEPPVYPTGGSKEAIAQYYKDKAAYDAKVQDLVSQYLSDPASLVGDGKIDLFKIPTDPAEAMRLYDQRYMTPIQKQLADQVAELKAAKAQEIQKWSKNWDAYNSLGDDYDAKRKYLAEHPEFAAYLAARNKSRGQDSWWLRERQQRSGGGGRSFSGGGRSGGGRGRSGGSGRSYGGSAPTDYSNLFPSIAAWAQRTPKAPGVSNQINPILWQMTGRKYGSK